LLAKPYGHHVDWWSLGVVLFELFTGKNPFDAKDFDGVLSNILHAKITPPDYVPSSARELIEKLLQRNPQSRMCSGEKGSVEIQNHPFYKGVEWDKVAVKGFKAPFIPKGEENFDKSVEEADVPHGKGLNPKVKFDDFTYVSKSTELLTHSTNG